jgi:RNA 2',3'-cyclic 3'-phosphodiesterase
MAFSTSEKQPTSRVFFALWPDEIIQRQLAAAGCELAVLVQGKAIPWQNLHPTLVFLGEVPHERIVELIGLAESLRDFVCDLRLDALGAFCPGNVYIAPTHTPAALYDVVESLRKVLREMGYRIESKLFTAHVTLFRNVRRLPKPRPLDCVVWPVRGVRLLQSELRSSGARYRLLR